MSTLKRRYQYSKNQPIYYWQHSSLIEKLKNKLADNNISFWYFYLNFYPNNVKSYKGFLLDLNWYEVYTANIKKGAEKFYESLG